MPTIHIMHHRLASDTGALLAKLNKDVARASDLSTEKVWIFWHSQPLSMSFIPRWSDDGVDGPIVRVFCRETHSTYKVEAIVDALRTGLSSEFGCKASDIFVQIVRIADKEVFGGA